MINNRRQTVLLDRDGVIVRNRADHAKDWSEVEILPGALDALALLAQGRHRVFVVTNQSAVGRGMMSMAELEAIHERLGYEIEAAGGRVEGFLVCPHIPEDECSCRKPAPGLLYMARDDHGVDLGNCCLVGDHESDIAAAAAVGCPSILVLSGRTPSASSNSDATIVATDLLEAAQTITSAEAAEMAAGLA
jgi:D-glycero-D-manno-heptose 1,7-bisphosphate phosphatase